MPEDRTVQVRVSPELKRAVQVIVGQMQAETGEYLSWSDGLWEYLRRHEPGAIQKALETSDKDDTEE